MPDPDADLLEPLLAKVMRLAAMHSDDAVEVRPGTALTATEGVLLVEVMTAGEVTQQQMADQLRLDKSRVSRLCSALERKHLITRHRDQDNRRNLLVRITDNGEKTAARLRQTWREHHERILAAMSQKERHALLLGLRALARELAALHSE
ncbi:MAG TPA: MarR family transcriptional regulator [Amycolatopsis sp.]|jgi:DNA-binding MarR family transcriptional regulator|nr:MarR family transcriptional regulator [Amycolatopsis sp.]